jgi:hypothetical protein
MRPPIFAQQLIDSGAVCNGDMPTVLFSVAVIAAAAAVIFFVAAVYGPPLVRDLRDWSREKTDALDEPLEELTAEQLEARDRARMNRLLHFGDRRVH